MRVRLDPPLALAQAVDSLLVTYQASLDFFADPGIPGASLRPGQFRYDQFRSWASGVLGLPRDAIIALVCLGATGDATQVVLKTQIDFTTALGRLWCGTLRPGSLGHIGSVVRVSSAVASAPAVTRPKVDVKEPAKPAEPVVEDDTPTGPEPGATADSAIPVSEDGNDPLRQDEPVLPPDDVRPLSAEEFIKLVQEARDSEDPVLERADKDEPGAGARLYRINARTLERALTFFNTDLGPDGKCRVRGMRHGLHIWQIYTAYTMVTHPVKAGLNGLCIGPDVGYGKTMLVLLYVRTRAASSNL